MSFDFVDLTIYYGGKFVEDPEYRYEGDLVRYEAYDVDKLCYLEIVGLVKDEGYTNVETVYYSVPGLDLKSSLRKCFTHFESIDMLNCAMTYGEITVYVVHTVDEAILDDVVGYLEPPLCHLLGNQGRGLKEGHQRLPKKLHCIAAQAVVGERE